MLQIKKTISQMSRTTLVTIKITLFYYLLSKNPSDSLIKITKVLEINLNFPLF